MAEAVVSMLATIAVPATVVAVIVVANWPGSETPRRPLGDTTELFPSERL